MRNVKNVSLLINLFFFCLLFYINVCEMSTDNGSAGVSVPSSSVESGKKVTDVFVR